MAVSLESPGDAEADGLEIEAFVVFVAVGWLEDTAVVPTPAESESQATEAVVGDQAWNRVDAVVVALGIREGEGRLATELPGAADQPGETLLVSADIERVFRQVKPAFEVAARMRLKVYCHANGLKAVKQAIDAGVSAIVHGLYSDDEIYAEMAERKIAFIPTVHAFQSLLAIAKTEAARQNVEKRVDAHLSAVIRAFEHKVRVLPGSDSGPEFIPYGNAYTQELRLLLRAGIPFVEVIQSAATATLTEGAPSDFVLLDGLSVQHAVFRGQLLA